MNQDCGHGLEVHTRMKYSGNKTREDEDYITREEG